MDRSLSHYQLVDLLQKAYSGEMAAAYAYRGHWKSLRDTGQRSKIQQIENEEWLHREKVGAMLVHLGATPVKTREIRSWIIGRTLGLLCHCMGWFFPMYFAGKLETKNVDEYKTAATYAKELNLTVFEDELEVMAAVEKEHEIFFFSVIANHRLLPVVRYFLN